MIIDAHVHIFRSVAGRVGEGPVEGAGYGQVSIGGRMIRLMPPLCERTTHTAEMLIAHMDWARVDKAILLQGPFYGDWNRYVLEAAEKFPDRLVPAAHLDPWAETSRKRFDVDIARNGFVAVKLECSEPTGLMGIHPGASLASPNVAWLWDELERLGIALVLDLGGVGSSSYQTDAVRRIALDHPKLSIVIAHLGQPTPAVAASPTMLRMWKGQIELGRLPNVWFDTASLPAYFADEGWPYPGARRFIEAAIEQIGVGKILWGSDIPGLLSHATYPQLLQLARHHLESLGEDGRALVLGGNAARVFGIPA